jgi:copper chaperone
MKELELKFTGMHCGGCENRVKNAVGDIKGVKSVTADHEACKVSVEFKKDVDEAVVTQVKEAIERLDFKVEE